MTKKISKPKSIVCPEIIEHKILCIRKQKVMLDKDLAFLYQVETRDLNKAVTRNIDRFPNDFCFRLNKDEFKSLMFHFGTSNRGGTRKPPHVFTEHGILMLSSVLKSKRAIHVNIQIMRAFVKLRELMISHKDLAQKIERLERRFTEHDNNFIIIFETIKKLLEPPVKPKKPIGFHH